MSSTARAQLLQREQSISSRLGSPMGGVARKNETLLLLILALGALLGCITLWKAAAIALPASDHSLQSTQTAGLILAPSRRMGDVTVEVLQTEVQEWNSESLGLPELQSIASSLSGAGEPPPRTGEQETALYWSTDPPTRPGSMPGTPGTGRGAAEGQVPEDARTSVQQLPDHQVEADVLGSGAHSQSDLETGSDRQDAGDVRLEAPGTVVGESGAPIVPMGQQQLAEHQALINSVLQHGVGQQDATGKPSLHLHPVKVEHNITSKDFHMRYGSTFAVQPVLIRGSQSDWLDEQEWSFEAMSRSLKNVSLYDEDEENCREGQADRQTKECHSIKEHDPSLVGKAWASLAAVDLVGLGVSTYDALFDKQVELAKAGRYLYAHEVSCSQVPQLGDRLYQPKYFRNNFQDLSSINDPDSYQLMQESHFPSFFFGPRGSTSPLHSDAGMTRFWILQLAGKKLVRLLPPAENSRASPTDEDLYLPSLFTADLLHPNFKTHPGLDGAIVYEALLEPGDILHIPEGWGHQALNLEWSAMVSTNYMDDQARSNLMNYLAFDEPDERNQSLVEMHQFFLPLVNMSAELQNIPMSDYFGSHALETAPVSDAAKAHVNMLRWLGLKPDQWHDYYSRSLLTVSVVNNYLQLAQWLVEQGMPVSNDPPHRQLLKYVDSEGLEKMGAWLRQQIGIPVDDEVPEVLEFEVAANDSSTQSTAQQDVAQQQAGGDGTEEKAARTSLR